MVENKKIENDIKEKLVAINRITKVVKGGRRFGFAALVVVGNQKGSVGIGQGKSKQVPDAIKKATEVAKKSLVQIPLKDGRTLHHDVKGKNGSGKVFMSVETIEALEKQEFQKGDVLGVARVAGIQAAKKTSDLIPLCHPLAVNFVSVDFRIRESHVEIETTVEIFGKTGVEMEALTACTVTALTIYDMCKAMDKSVTIEEIKLLEKTGGKSGDWERPE